MRPLNRAKSFQALNEVGQLLAVVEGLGQGGQRLKNVRFLVQKTSPFANPRQAVLVEESGLQRCSEK